MRSKATLFILAVLCGVVVSALGAPVAAAGGLEPVRIETQGVLTGPTSVAGTFTISGAFSDAGTFTESLEFVGPTVRGVKTLIGSRGTITLKAQAVMQATSPTQVTLDGGHWRFLSGMGAYFGIRGGGSPGVVGSADLAAGTVHAVHEGRVRAARGDPSSIGARVVDLAFVELSPECAHGIVQADFRLEALDGSPLGTGSSCVERIKGCDPFSPGCRQVVKATLRLELSGGGLVVPVAFREQWPSETTVLQLGTGKIASGSGVFADARGRMLSAGRITFGETGIDADLWLVLLLRRD